MNIQLIEKTIYRKKLNIVSVTFVLTLAVLALVFGSVFIALFSTSTLTAGVDTVANPDMQSNFRYNLAGVVLALVTMGMIANMIKGHDYFKEVYYVWRLKQLHNRIYRKLVKVKAAQASEDKTISTNAQIILAFYYTTLKQVYELDDNTLTIAKVESDIEKLQQQSGLETLDSLVKQFDKALLSNN